MKKKGGIIMILKIENLEINLKGVFKALLWTSIGVGLCRAANNAGRYTAFVVLNNQKKEQKTSKKETKVESK